MEIIKLNKSDFEEKSTSLQSEVKIMVTESHEVQNKQLESLRKDTESQFHGICSMIEELQPIMKQSETKLSTLILSKLETKIQETEEKFKD